MTRQLNLKLLTHYQNELQSWPLLKNNAAALDQLIIKEIAIANDKLKVQLNPQRIQSVTAKIDKDSIQARKCFLCSENRPKEQQALELGDGYLGLSNPFPIFKEHFTITHKNHIAQTFQNNAADYLNLSQKLGDKLVLFFNGAKSGASAPDHLHFQACPASAFPLVDKFSKTNKLFKTLDQLQLYQLNFAQQNYLLVESQDSEQLANYLNQICKKFNDENLNIISIYNTAENKWQVCLIFRRKHRPDCYFADEPHKILLSLATVELAGVVVTIRQEDFNACDSETIKKAFDQVCLRWDEFEKYL